MVDHNFGNFCFFSIQVSVLKANAYLDEVVEEEVQVWLFVSPSVQFTYTDALVSPCVEFTYTDVLVSPSVQFTGGDHGRGRGRDRG